MRSLPAIHRALLGSILLCGALALASPAAAGVPTSVTHQGRLFDAGGLPVDKTLPVVFTLYDAAEGGAITWSETHDIPFDDGYFSASLGEDSPLDTTVFDGSTLFLGIKVGDDPEMSPRARVASVPYAIMASDV